MSNTNILDRSTQDASKSAREGLTIIDSNTQIIRDIVFADVDNELSTVLLTTSCLLADIPSVLSSIIASFWNQGKPTMTRPHRPPSPSSWICFASPAAAGTSEREANPCSYGKRVVGNYSYVLPSDLARSKSDSG